MAAEWDDLEPVKRPELWNSRLADERFVELLTTEDLLDLLDMGIAIEHVE
jgi:hypothetical protein